MLIDSHIHSDTRSFEDLQALSTFLDCVITHAHDPMPVYSFEVCRAHFDKLLKFEPKRFEKAGLNFYICIGIHPRAIPEKIDDIDYQILKEYLKDKKVVGLGEVGLELATDTEIVILKKQMALAECLKKPIVLHTPRTNKYEITKKLLEVIEDSDLTTNIAIEHVDFENIDLILDYILKNNNLKISENPDYKNNIHLGITVQPQKLTPESAMDLIKYIYQRDDLKPLRESNNLKIMINSDISSAPSDIFSLLKMKVILEKNSGVLKSVNYSANDIINNILGDNAKEIFNL
ncbi:TatD family hydrolase [Methanococcus voltae]|uniref:TatD-related deoxyribonuclease n=1 Tax=Methanococcus voltae (strain ATCC BAA-1334 / A3) TaxID=456320 RepID=D7DR05_METV3|nr:TatD family hydrolase [Methanococcus voltae]MCS3900942.1 putative metal-dependent TIM-barrel fold hydrolase [Methanococcus voltae]